MVRTKWIIITLIIATIGSFGGYYITSTAINWNEKSERTVDKESQTSAQMRPDAEGIENSLTKTQSQGAVAVQATLISEKNSMNKLVFEIVMNTHTVDLQQYEISNLAEVSFGDKPNSKNFEWKPFSKDSHHMMGTLTWSGEIKDDYENISLNLKTIDDMPSRVFTWDKEELKGINPN